MEYSPLPNLYTNPREVKIYSSQRSKTGKMIAKKTYVNYKDQEYLFDSQIEARYFEFLITCPDIELMKLQPRYILLEKAFIPYEKINILDIKNKKLLKDKEITQERKDGQYNFRCNTTNIKLIQSNSIKTYYRCQTDKSSSIEYVGDFLVKYKEKLFVLDPKGQRTKDFDLKYKIYNSKVAEGKYPPLLLLSSKTIKGINQPNVEDLYQQLEFWFGIIKDI